MIVAAQRPDEIVGRRHDHDFPRLCELGWKRQEERCVFGAVRERAGVPMEDVVDAVADALAARFGDAPFRAPLAANFLVARRPR